MVTLHQFIEADEEVKSLKEWNQMTTKTQAREITDAEIFDFEKNLEQYLAVRDRTPDPTIVAALEIAAKTQKE